MNWLGPAFRMMYAPRHDAVAVELNALLHQQRGHNAEIRESRIALQRTAGIEPLDDLAERR